MPARKPKPMAREISFFLPGVAVSVNRAYTSNHHLTKAAKKWREDVSEYTFAEARLANFPIGATLLGARVSHMLIGGRGDVDNVCKLLWDGIAEGLGVNDRIFSLGAATRERKPRGGVQGVRVTIEATVVREGVA